MTEVSRDRFYLIYALMCEDIEVNVGVVFFLAIKKARSHVVCRYGFGGLLTQFIKGEGVDKEDLDYRPSVNMRPVYISLTKGIVGSQGPILTIPERQT